MSLFGTLLPILLIMLVRVRVGTELLYSVSIAPVDCSKIQAVKETTRRRITVTSSLNKISTDQLGNRVGMRG